MLSLLITMVTVAMTADARCSCDRKCCSDLCQKVLFWIIFLTVCSASNHNNITPVEAEDICKTISPREAYFLEGEDIVLTCSGMDSDILTFARGGKAEIVPEEFIHKLNDTTIKMVIPNVTAKDIDSINYSVPYKCVNKYNKTQCYDNVHVQLEYYPREPQNLECRDYDFNEMTCSWSLGVDYHRPEKVNVTCEIANFSYKSDNHKASWAPCPNQSAAACHWNPDEYLAAYMMYVKVSVTARNITKEKEINFYQHDIVEPGPVKNLKISKTNKAGRCVELEWEPTDKYYSFKFELNYTSACSEKRVKTVKYFLGRNQDDKWDSRIVCGLTPYTVYTFSVKGRLIQEKEVDNKTYVERGHWSKASTIVARTDSDVLDVNPETVTGLYELSSITRPGLQGYVSLHLFWTPLTECALYDAEDSVTYSVTAYNRTTSVTHPAFMARIDVPESKIINVTLQASNSAGHPNSKRVVTVFPGSFGPSLSELIVQYNNTDEVCLTQFDVVVTEKSLSFTDLYHTLVWCEGTQLLCQRPLHWMKLEGNGSTFGLPGNQCDVDYRYGLVTHGYSKGQGQVVNSGVHWEHCMYKLGKAVDEPVANVHLTDIQPDNGFSVAWTPFSCTDMEAYITHYLVMYCVGEGQEDCTCTTDKVSVKVSRQLFKYTTSDLEAGSLICVWVRGVSKAGVGPANLKPLFHRTNADSGTIIVWIGLAVLVVLILLITCVYFVRRKWKNLKREADNIRIPGYDPLQQERFLQSDVGNNNSLQVSPDRLPKDLKAYSKTDNGADDKETARKYSIHDITDVLLPTENSQSTTEGFSGHMFNDEHKTMEQEWLETQEGKKLVGRGDATCLVPDKDNAGSHKANVGLHKAMVEPGHWRYSISSALSDAHSEPFNQSLEDLLWDHQNSRLLEEIAGDCIELESFLSPYKDSTSTDKPKPLDTEQENKDCVETCAGKLHKKETEGYKSVDCAKKHEEDKNGVASGRAESTMKEESNQNENSVIQNGDIDKIHPDVCAKPLAQTEKIEPFDLKYSKQHAACQKPGEQQSDNENQELKGFDEQLHSVNLGTVKVHDLSDTEDPGIKENDLSSIDGSLESIGSETEKEKSVGKDEVGKGVGEAGNINLSEDATSKTRGLVPNGSETFPNGHRNSNGSDISSERQLSNGNTNQDNSWASVLAYVKADQVDIINDLQNGKLRNGSSEATHDSNPDSIMLDTNASQNKQVHCYENGKKNGVKTNIPSF